MTFTPGNGTGRLIVVKQDTPVDFVPTNYQNYNSNATHGSTYGNLGNGNYAVYKGTASTASLNLQPNTKYYVAAFEYNGINYPVFSITDVDTFSFTTKLPPSPTVPSKFLVIQGLEGNSMQLVWTRGDGERRMVIVRKGSPVTAVPVNGVQYTGNKAFNLADEVEPGQKVIYDGTGYNTNVDSLEIGTTYYVKVIEYNGTGNITSYLMTETLSGSRATLSAPTVSASEVYFELLTLDKMRIFWRQGSGSRRIILGRKNAPVDGVPEDLKTYSASTNFGGGSKIGENSVVFNYTYYGRYGDQYQDTLYTDVSGMEAGNTYYFKIFEYNGVGAPVYKQADPAVASFTITFEPPTPATNFRSTSQDGNTLSLQWTVGGGDKRVIVAREGQPVDVVPQDGVDYAENKDFKLAQEIAPGQRVVYDGASYFTYPEGLNPNTEYFFKIFEYGGTGVNIDYLTSVYDSTFASTKSAPTIQASNLVVSAITPESGNVSWTNGDGERRITVAKKGSPVTIDPKDTTTYSANYFGRVASHLGDGNYVVYKNTANNFLMSQLESGTTYHLAVYEMNGSTGPVLLRPPLTGQFTTLGPPLENAVVGTATEISSNSFHINFTVGSGQKRLIVMREGSPVDAQPVDDVNYIDNTFLGAGDELGTGNFVVYDGEDNNIIVTGLNPGTEYYFTIFEYNAFSGGTILSYLRPSNALGTVTTDIENRNPVLTEVGNKIIGEQETLTFTALATDVDVPAQNLTFSLDAAAIALGMTIDPTSGEFSWIPTESQGGADYAITINVTDNGTNPDNLSDSEILTITVNDVNVTPELAIIGNKIIDEQATLTFTASATDTDLPAQTLTFSLDAASVLLGMIIDPNTGEFSWTPTELEGGADYSVTVTVTDNGTNPDNLSDSEILTITVNEVNIAPVLAAVGNKFVNEQSLLTFVASATDQDDPAQTLTYSLDAAAIALGMTINSTTGEFNWTPSESQGGNDYSVTITVTDNGSNPDNLTDLETFTITVNNVLAINTAPVLTSIGTQIVDEQSNLSFAASAIDLDLPAQNLTFSLDAASVLLGMTIDPNTGEFSWIPTESQGGADYAITINVTDNGTNPDNLSDSEILTITVNDVNVTPELAIIGNKIIDEQATLTFTASATDTDLPAQTLTFSLDAASVLLGMIIDPNTGEFSWTPTELEGGADYSVTITVTDNGTNPDDLSDFETITITANEVNLAPELAVIGNKLVNEQSTLTFTASATDTDLPAQNLTYSLDATSVLLGMTINPTSGEFSWIPTELQGGADYLVTITVADNGANPNNLSNFETITITVNEVNVAPELAAIGNKFINEQSLLTFVASATDQDLPAQNLTFTLDQASIDAGMSINSTTGEFNWTPSELQGGADYLVTITITDNGTNPDNLSDSETFTITVNEVNIAPVLAAVGNKFVNEQSLLTFVASATDQDDPAQTLTYSLDAAAIALGMTINSTTGEFNWTPSESQGGNDYSVTITVTDNGSNPDNLTDLETFTITVNNVLAINTAPVLTSIGTQIVDEQSNLSFAASAIDLDLPAQNLTFSLDAASVLLGMTIDPNTGEFSWTPTELKGGADYAITINVTDNGTNPDNLSDSEILTITVNDVNVTPELAIIGNKIIDEQATLTFTASATDTDLPAQTLTFSLDAASVLLGMTIDPTSGEFSWIPTELQGGADYLVTITVADNGANPNNLSDFETITITANEVNLAPELAAIGNKFINEQSLLTFVASATDQDLPAQNLTFTLDQASIDAGMSINSTTGEFNWTPSELQGGADYLVTITITDNGTNPNNLSDFETFIITVNEVLAINTAPELASTGNQTVDEQSILTFTASATDLDLPAQTLTYTLDAAAIALGMTINSTTGGFNWTPSELQGGADYLVTITVTDNGTNPNNLSDSVTITIVVNKVLAINTAPELASTGNQTVDEQSILTFTASATDLDLPAQTLSFSLDAASVLLGMTIDPTSGEFSWTPTELQGGADYPITINVTDNGTNPDNLSDSEILTITVNDVNVTPELAIIGNKIIDEQATLTFTASATDTDLPAQTLTFSLDAASVLLGMTIDPTSGEFSWIPTELQGGADYSVTVTVTDNGTNPNNLSDFETITITVNEVNVAPELAAVGNKLVNEQSLLTFVASATDQDLPAQNLTFTLDQASIDAGMTINSTTGEFNWTPSELQGGFDYSVTITTTDNGTNPDNLSDSVTITIAVNKVLAINTAPELASTGNQTVDEQSILTFTASATDLDLPAQTLSFSLDAASVLLGMTINPTTGEFSWTPTELQGGVDYSVTITATDNGTNPDNLSDSITITIVVNKVLAINTAPVLAYIENQTVNSGETLLFTAVASDVDLPANSLTFSLNAAPEGAFINPLTGEFSWNPASTQTPGEYTFSVVVTDNGVPVMYDNLEITVTLIENHPGELISSYTILAEEEIHLLHSNQVASGGVGVTKPGGKIKIQLLSHITEFAQASKIETFFRSSVGNAIYSPAKVSLPKFISNTYSNKKSPDVKIKKNKTEILNGEVYGKVELEQGATVIFTGSNIYLDDLKLNYNTSVKFESCSNVYINKQLIIDRNSRFNSAGYFVKVFVDGNVFVREGADVTAQIHANYHDIFVLGRFYIPTKMNGLFIARRIHGLINVTWNKVLFLNPCEIQEPEIADIHHDNEEENDNEHNKVESEKSVEIKTGISLGNEHSEFKVYPNPFNKKLHIEFVSPLTTNARIDIYDMTGRHLKTIFNKQVDSNVLNQAEFIPKTLVNGIYLYRLAIGNEIYNGKVIYKK